MASRKLIGLFSIFFIAMFPIPGLQGIDSIHESGVRTVQAAEPCPLGLFRAEYFNNATLNGNPVYTRCEAAIDYTWNEGGPGGGLGNDNYSVRWTGRHRFEAGTYAFTVQTDDGARLWLDGQQVHAAWKEQGR